MTDSPDPIDVHVGARLRQIRKIRGVSQQDLANGLSLTFQQIQKYEKGTNRISASMLWKAAKHLQVPVDYFFDGLSGEGTERPALSITVADFPQAAELAFFDPRTKAALGVLIVAAARGMKAN